MSDTVETTPPLFDEERAELRRLRSDNWLKRAAEEITTAPALPTSLFDTAHVLAILKKHRGDQPPVCA